MNRKFYRSSFKKRTEIGGQYVELCGTVFQSQRARLARGLRGSFMGLVHRSMELRTFGAFIQLDDTGIGNLPAESLYVALLLVALFEEDGLSGVGRQVPSGGEGKITRARGHPHPATQQNQKP